MSDPRQDRLNDFVAWARQHVTGDEKGQAQIFLDRLFQAFGQRGSLDVGGGPEFRIRKAKEDGGGTAFADYVWKPVVLIEMKKRGVDLSRHFRQAFDYWIRLVPDRPKYTVLSNFDEFWIYDFNVQMDSPLDRLALDELPQRYGPLAFLFPTNDRPVFRNDQEAVTRDAADRLVTCFNKLVARNVPRTTAQAFTLQMLVALFAEDIDLLPKYFVTRLLDDCKTKADSYDLIGGLFEAMNTPGGVHGGRFKGVQYFNGGLFREPARIELYPDELAQLHKAAESNWSQVRPEIFGAIFEASMEHEERHAFGAHFTSPVDIMKIVGPTIVEPWRQLIENATTVTELNGLLGRMHDYRVLDPACGSGNFLYIAYRELKRLEVRAYERLAELSKRRQEKQYVFGFVTADQFYGMDVNPFAVELAKVTMMIGRKLAIDELHITEPALPLDNLDNNFTTCDALISFPSPSQGEGQGEGSVLSYGSLPANKYSSGSLPLEGRAGEGESPANRSSTRTSSPLPNPPHQGEGTGGNGSAIPTTWPPADVIIGNPPFLGAKRLKPERGPDYVNAVRRLYPEVPGMADYCVYWFNRANHHLPVCTPERPERGRAGLVGTQNIRNNKSREGGLDHIVRTGVIVEAVDNQPWSGEANVHVSIANWVKHTERAAGFTPADQGRAGSSPTPANSSGPLPLAGRAGEGVGSGYTPQSPLPNPPPQGEGTRGNKKGARVSRDAQGPPAAERAPRTINEPALLIPAKRKLWFKVETAPGAKKPKRRGSGPANKEYELNFRQTDIINSALSDEVDVSVKRALECNKTPKRCFQGKIPGYSGFMLDAKEAERISKDSAEVIVPYLTGRELLDQFQIDRWAIDFGNRDIISARSFALAFRHCEQNVLNEVTTTYEDAKRETSDMEDARREHLERWWQFWNRRDQLNEALAKLDRYIGCSRVTRRPVMAFISTGICPSDLVQVFAFDDDYSFGVLQSSAHFEWFRKSSRLKVESDIRYSVRAVFDTFPWPQSPAAKLVAAVAEAGREVRRVREDALTKVKGGLRAVYRTLELPGKNPLKDAHAALDAAGIAAYGFSPKKDLLAQLLELNLAVAERIDRGEQATAPGIPPDYPNPNSLITGDCIRPA